MGTLSRRAAEDDEDLSAFWLLTYSDMITLLLAFFLLMYAFSVMSETGQDELVGELRTVADNSGRARPSAELEEAAREIAAQFAHDQAFVENTEAEVTVGLSSEVTFATGDDALSPGGREALLRVAAVLARLPNGVRVEGHTDAVPVRGGRFGSNWHLSVARAQSVVRLLIERGVDPRRVQVIGFGDVRPRAANDTPEGRAANRRIELKIVRNAAESARAAAGGGS